MAEIFYTKQAMKSIKVIDSRIKEHIRVSIERIPLGDIKKLKGYTSLYRLRVGDYRIIYEVNGDKIIIQGILPRGEAYKRL